MLRSINRAHRLEPNHPNLHSCLVRFLRHTGTASLDSIVGEVVARQSSGIFSGASSGSQLNADYLKSNPSSLPHLLQGARMLYLLEPTAQQRAISLATSLEPSLRGLDLGTCTMVLEALRSGDFGLCEEAIADYTAKCHERFPYATAFRPPEPSKPLLANHQDQPKEQPQQQQPTPNKY